MGYITTEYYTDTFKGASAGDELEKYIERATDVIDEVTNWKLHSQDIEIMPDIIKDQVKKATALQVEFYVMQGGDEAVNAGEDDLSQVRVGSFQYHQKENGKGVNASRVSPAAINALKPTGLLYSGISPVQRPWYSTKQGNAYE